MAIKKIIQIGDIHIRKYDRHDEYIEVFNNLYKSVKKETEGLSSDEIRIVVCGDIVHQKNNISPELDILMSNLFNMLESISKTIIIAGNHDYLINNTDRLDSISHIVKIKGYKNLCFADMALDYQSGLIEDDNVCWALYSTFDSFAEPKGIETYKKKNPDKKIIGLFHGQVVGSKTDMGHVMDNGINADLFKSCDAVLSGHIHKFQTIRKNGVPIVYCGSLIQQDFGENVSGHGYVSWNLDDLSYEQINVENKRPMYVIEISDIDDIDNNTERFLNL